ncbi:hypothetical protein GPJ56_004009 [Histomonas meleagridis]|uniref:uncharacterized protein n=1 Tax=Histomonas meleagridis TaxID=135588 RepID=UPI00355A6677|nr:hypothetical protein GPJ56_004009 [Histomonas meleagridis]KAH0804873.1 hypothetical protein GO595_002323 [Histomonas meleagridis]
MNQRNRIDERWNHPEFEPLRIATLVFGGDLSTEAAIASFPEVQLLIRESETGTTTKGVFYLTTNRFVYLPKNTIPHPQIVQCSYEALRGLSGVRSTSTISVIDGNGASANFQFPTQQTLFQCFKLLRQLAEAVRMDESKLKSVIGELLSKKTFDETPFSSLDIELEEVKHSEEAPHAAPESKEEENPIVNVLAPMKQFFEYVISLKFNIHTKLSFLFVLSLVSFCLQYIPFIPFLSMCTALFILSNAWRLMNRKKLKKQVDTEIPKSTEGFVKTQRFVSDWLQWRSPRKTISILGISSTFFIGWLILPKKLYIVVTVIWYFVFITFSLEKKPELKSLLSGYWTCT